MSSEDLIEPHEPLPDCDCCACAKAERDRLRGQVAQIEQWQAQGEQLLLSDRLGVAFRLGMWFADRPWRRRAARQLTPTR
jgi:hypothetical protein